MSRISDIIEQYIQNEISRSQGEIRIQRNEMADFFDCAPSQINYVLTTRFTSDRGYCIESRRGGGGCIKITRISINRNEYLTHFLSQKIGASIKKERAFELIEILLIQNLINEEQKNMMKAAVDDNTLSVITKPLRDDLRADILKAVIIAALKSS